MSDFLGDDPSVEDYWRGIILFGKNVASYKFALAQSLLELAPCGKSIITLKDLAEPFSRNLCEHLSLVPKQTTSPSSKYLRTCQDFNAGIIGREQLVEATVKLGFECVIDAFHKVNKADIPVRFFSGKRQGAKSIALTDELFEMLESVQGLNLPQEVEARWRLVETAWELNISRNLIGVDYDADKKLLFVQRPMSRTNITSCRSALNGYQKGKCFYCFGDISIVSGTEDLTDVDHFFPRVLINCNIAHPVDGIWNLVLACVSCNRGVCGKFDQLPHQRYLERLNTRNEFLIDSNHPLGETLVLQTGNSKPKRLSFLNRNYEAAKTGRLINSSWQPAFEYLPAF
jgi:5-methylcytosine-specific restriction endonuclease McrA